MKKALKAKALASSSIGCSNRPVDFELQQTIRLIQSVQNEFSELDKQIKLIIDELDIPMVKRGSTYLRWAIMQAVRLVSMGDTTYELYL